MSALIEEFLSQPHITAMEAGLVRKTLLRPQRYNGGPVMTRAEYAEIRAELGNVRIDRHRARLHNTDTGTFFLFTDVTVAMVNYLDWLMKRKGEA